MPNGEQELMDPDETPIGNSDRVYTPTGAALPVELWRCMLLAQLEECWNDIRNIDGLVWQIPTGIGAILGLVLTGLGSRVLQARPSVLGVGGMIAAALVSFALIVALRKNRIFQESRVYYLKAIYRALLETGAARDGEMVAVGLTFESDDDGIDHLPGFVPRSTSDLAHFMELRRKKSRSKPASFLVESPVLYILANSAAATPVKSVADMFARASAYKVMFRVSVLVLAGEILLAIWLLGSFLGW